MSFFADSSQPNRTEISIYLDDAAIEKIKGGQACEVQHGDIEVYVNYRKPEKKVKKFREYSEIEKNFLESSLFHIWNSLKNGDAGDNYLAERALFLAIDLCKKTEVRKELEFLLSVSVYV